MAFDRDKVLDAAQKFVEKKKYDKAVLELRKIIQADPNDARTRLKIGDLESKQEKYADAVATYEEVGKQYASRGFALKAIAVYKQIREIIAKHLPQAEAQYAHITPKLAELYQQLGLTSDALAALDEVATRLQRQQRDAEAIDVFHKIVELDPTNPLPHLRLAEALSRIQRVDAAVQEFSTAAAQLLKLGRRDDALKVIERLLHHKSDPVQARIAAELYLARGQQSDGMQALSKLQLCFQANPRDLDTLALLARAFNVIGQAGKAVEVQKEMCRIARDSGREDVLGPLLQQLLTIAPNDEGVRKLAMSAGLLGAPQPQAQAPARPPAPPGRPPPPPPPSSPGRRPPAPRLETRAEELSYEAIDTHDLIQEPSVQRDAQPYQAQQPPEPPPVSAPAPYRQRMVSEGQVEIVEQDAPELPPDASEQLAQILADAGSFRRVRLYPKAIATLKQGLELEPRSLEVREVLRDVYLEAGRAQDAVDEMLAMASIFIDSLDGEGAARMLQDVLTVDPGNRRAVEMLRELGYEYIEEEAQVPGDAGEDRFEATHDAPPAQQRYYAEGAEARGQTPLPSYDLEEVGPEDVSSEYSEPRVPSAARAPQYDQSSNGTGPLPSFPLDAPEAEASEPFDLVRSADGAVVTETDHEVYHGGDATEAVVPATRTSQAPPAPSAELEDALEEADFFASRGLYDDARTTLRDQLELHPNNFLLKEKLAEIDQLEQSTARGSGTRERPQDQDGVAQSVDRSFELAASLDAIEDTQVPAFESADKQVDVEEVFAKFKEGVAKQISLDDGQSHYDLGVAYKEMGLLDDAVREFETAARDPKRECICRSMIGMLQIERGNVNEGIDAFLRGLQANVKSSEQETMLWFELGMAYESKGMTRDALNYYQKVMRREPNYRDVQERVRRLSAQTPSKAPARQAAVGDDEFDRAFDDLIEKT